MSAPILLAIGCNVVVLPLGLVAVDPPDLASSSFGCIEHLRMGRETLLPQLAGRCDPRKMARIASSIVECCAGSDNGGPLSLPAEQASGYNNSRLSLLSLGELWTLKSQKSLLAPAFSYMLFECGKPKVPS